MTPHNKASSLNICAFCQQKRELCSSHAIPNGLFRSILRNSNGQVTIFNSEERKIKKCQETGKSMLLCKICESNFNQQFDSPFVNTLKAWDRKIIEEGFGFRHTFNPSHIAQSLASIFWRASVSKNELYSEAKISRQHQAQLLSIVKNNREQTLKYCSVSIKRVYDSSYDGENGFSQSTFANIILPVNAYRISRKRKKLGKHFAFTVMMQGFLFWMMLPKLSFNELSKPGFLNRKVKRLHAPPIHFQDYFQLNDVLNDMKSVHFNNHQPPSPTPNSSQIKIQP